MTFEEIYSEFQKIDPADYKRVLEDKAQTVLPTLFGISGNENTGARFLSMFVIGAALADGELEQKEFELLEPMFTSFFGDTVSFAESRALSRALVSNNKDMGQKLDEMIDFFGEYSDNLKADLVLICLLICAVDGNVSEAERNWISRLVA